MKHGGINGKQVEFKTEDDQADAEKAVNAYNTLKDWGTADSDGNCNIWFYVQQLASETDSDHMFQITPSGTAAESVQDHDNVLPSYASQILNQGTSIRTVHWQRTIWQQR